MRDALEGDLNGDSLVTADDLDLLLSRGPLFTAVAVDPELTAQYDLNHDGLLSLADRDRWLSTAAWAGGYASTFLPGDANLDGAVDEIDYDRIVSQMFVNSTAWTAGDFNADGVVDGSDFNLWSSHRSGVATNTASLPEPGAWIPACIGLVIAARGWAKERRGCTGRSDFRPTARN